MRTDEVWQAQLENDQQWQQSLMDDPAYLEWLNNLESQKQHAAAQAFEDQCCDTF